jgi:hypothetical protein
MAMNGVVTAENDFQIMGEKGWKNKQLDTNE